MRSGHLLALLLMVIWAHPGSVKIARCQTQSRFQTAWQESFERGSLGDELQFGHNAGPHNVRVADLKSPEIPSLVLERDRENHCGRNILHFNMPPGSSRLTVAMAKPFKRQLQGPNDRVVFQADVFLPDQLTGSASLIGIAPPDSTGKHPWKLFRLGIQEGKVFFAFANGDPSPFLYLEDTVLFGSLERDCWHRLQMEYRGPDSIVCYVDGVPAAFSPITLSALYELEAGLLVVSGGKQPGSIYADNLGVIWKQGGTEMPASPWQPSLADKVAANSEREGGIPWAPSVEDGKRQASGSDRNLALMFYGTDIGAMETLDKIMRFDPSCKDVLSGFVPCRVDISADPGRELGRQLGIFRVPCIVMYSPDGRELDRIFYDRETSWPDLVKRLLQYQQ